MPKVRTLHVPRFSSQQGSGQRSDQDGAQTLEQAEPLSRSSHTDKRGNKRGDDKREKTRSVLKVKLPKLNSRTFPKKVSKEDIIPARWMVEPDEPKTSASQGSIRDSATDAGEVFFFSQRSDSKATTEKEKAKLSVLRTISKMLEENQLIRQRLAALRLTN